jgi:hypothetical protein
MAVAIHAGLGMRALASVDDAGLSPIAYLHGPTSRLIAGFVR